MWLRWLWTFLLDSGLVAVTLGKCGGFLLWYVGSLLLWLGGWCHRLTPREYRDNQKNRRRRHRHLARLRRSGLS
jgi:hypothetical protein